ncbi:hypothetical protein L3Y34_007098 [Caenorhabditis briggsae]|uniref:Uncharacterized protein n=1 Tax=Caenorhabditis briggsae TaxID=6238 RepID=A0AAE9A5M2_CAEBR|nr:hypothetical protein L3Y34_007098 [Caenorhabditis briggsae]
MSNRAFLPSSSTCCYLALFILTLLTFFVFVKQNNTITNFSQPASPKQAQNETKTGPTSKNSSEELFDLESINAVTYKGHISLKELNEEVFQPFGYEIIKPTLPVPTIRMIKEPTCDETFSEWIKIANMKQPDVPPIQVPIIHADDYIMNNFAALSYGYMNNNTRNEKKPTNWHRLGEIMSFSKVELGQLEYQVETQSMYHAMNGYRLDGKTGIVVGSMQPWLEVMAFQNGASKILTVEHYKLDIPDQFRDILTDIRPMDLATSWKKYAGSFDFAASFSIIHHFGLGRFGDPLDAIGDLREMRKIQCLLKQGGILYLAVPIGTDALQFNVQRIYGAIRLAMMFVGYEWVATYSHESRDPITLSSEVLHKPLFISQHYTLVLRKM